MQGRTASLTWAVVFAVLVAFAVPWFMWRDATVVAGLPVWLWWHIGWLGVTAVVFYTFSQRAWGLWVGGET